MLVGVNGPPQLSDTIGGDTRTVAVHDDELVGVVNVTVPPQVMFGLVLSTTVTLNTQVAVLPDASVAVSVTVCVPGAKLDPNGGTDVITTGPMLRQLSVADAVHVAI